MVNGVPLVIRGPQGGGIRLAAQLAVHERGHHERLVVHQTVRGHRNVHLTRGCERGPGLHLHGHIRAVGQSVYDRVDTHVSQWKEHVQSAHRLADQLRPNLEPSHLASGQSLAIVPPDICIQPGDCP